MATPPPPTVTSNPVPTSTQEAYAKWKTSTFGSPYDIWHDGLWVEAVTTLSGEARTTAKTMLLYGLSTFQDGNAATALAALGEVSALPALREALEKSSGTYRVDIAQAIHKLTSASEEGKEKEKEKTAGGDDVEASNPMARELITVLENPEIHWGTKINAAMGLRQYRDLESEDALLRVVDSPDQVYLVTYHSCESLLIRWGVEPASISSHREIFALIGDNVAGKAERRTEAGRLMRELKQGKVEEKKKREEKI